MEETGIVYLIGTTYTGLILFVVMQVGLIIVGIIYKMNLKHLGMGLEVVRVGL